MSTQTARATGSRRMDNFYIAQLFEDWKLPPRPSRKVAAINRLLRTFTWLQLGPAPFSGSTSTIEQRMNMYHLLSQVLAYRVPGDIVELGCYRGETSAMFRMIIDQFDTRRGLHVYDSFEGLPDKHEKDGRTKYRAGEMATRRDVLIENFHRHGLRLPDIHAGWFQQTLPHDLPERIAFAYLDSDFYEPLMLSLRSVYPRLTPGAICLIDDYADPTVYPDAWNELEGAKQAVDEFLADKPERLTYVYSGALSHAFFRKK